VILDKQIVYSQFFFRQCCKIISFFFFCGQFALSTPIRLFTCRSHSPFFKKLFYRLFRNSHTNIIRKKSVVVVCRNLNILESFFLLLIFVYLHVNMRKTFYFICNHLECALRSQRLGGFCKTL
jgi:hypothetical protein